MVYYQKYILSFSFDYIRVKIAMWMWDISFSFILNGCFWLLLNNRASITVFVKLVKERLKIPSVKSSIKRSSQLRLRWMVDKMGAVV